MTAKTKTADVQSASRSRQRPERLSRFHYLIACGIGVVALLIYLVTLTGNVLPGEPADVLTNLSGIKENLMMRHVVWRTLIGLVIRVSGSHFVVAVNGMSLAFSVLSVAMIYLLAVALIHVMVDREHLNLAISGHGRRHAENMCVLAGSFSAVTLAFSPPFWFTATQCYAHAFYLFWLLLSLFLLLRFAETLGIRSLFAFCLLFGAGMAQTSSFVAFAPLVFPFAIFILWQNDRLNSRVFWQMVALTAVGGSVVILNAVNFYGSEGYALLGIDGFLPLQKRLVMEVLRGVFGSLPRVGWMIVLGLTIAPCLAILLTGYRALNGEKDWSFYALHVAVLFVTVCVVLDLSFSPWQFFNLTYLQIVPYAMTALTFGYLVAYLYAQTLYLIPVEQDNGGRGSLRVTQTVIVLVATALSVFAFFNNRAETDHRRMDFIRLYADTLLDNLDGREWLLTNGVLDDVVRIRARERGDTVHLISLADANNRVALQRIKRNLNRIRLQNAADIGLFALVQEWISNDPDAGSELGLCLFPDLWNVGDYEVYPHGLAFFGADAGRVQELAASDLKTPYFAILDAFVSVFARIPDDINPRLAFYRQLVTGQISFVGNNLGYFLETQGQRETAFEVYRRVHAFDPNNVSALLNFASMVQSGMHPELKDEVMASLETFQRSLKAPLEIWSLSRTFGYVSAPEAFARLGWTWAMSGQSNLALKSLSRALEDLRPERRSQLRTVMADVYLQNNDLLAGERVYHEILAEDPGDHRALIGLVRIKIINADAEGAVSYLAKAREAGVPLERLLYETVALNLMLGDLDRAQIVANELIALNPDNPEAHTIKSVIHAERFLAATSSEATEVHQREMLKAAAELERISGANDFQTLFVKGRINMIMRNYSLSREFFIQALRNARTPHVVPLLDSILRMDHALADKASALRHAREILHRAPDHGFANYIMGSLALEKEDYLSAEDYLSRSLKSEPTSVFVLNDLAIAKLKLGKIDEAETLVRRSFETDDQIYAAWDTLGSVLMARGEIDKAAEAFDTALKLNDKDLRVHLHIAQVHFQRGELEKSREIVRKLAAGADIFIGDDLREYEELARALLGRSR